MRTCEAVLRGGSGGSVNSLDATAIAFCRDNDIPIVVFDMSAPGTLQADLRRLVGAVEAVGGEVVVVDLTRAELGLPVVRVLTPGLEGHPHYDAPGVRTAVPR